MDREKKTTATDVGRGKGRHGRGKTAVIGTCVYHGHDLSEDREKLSEK